MIIQNFGFADLAYLQCLQIQFFNIKCMFATDLNQRKVSLHMLQGTFICTKHFLSHMGIFIERKSKHKHTDLGDS